MEDINSKQKNIEIKSNNFKHSSYNKSKFSLFENKLIKNEVSKKKLSTKEIEVKHKSKFSNKLVILKDKMADRLNKPEKEKNFKNKKRNSVSQDLITKIFEINKEKSTAKSDNSNLVLIKKKRPFQIMLIH